MVAHKSGQRAAQFVTRGKCAGRTLCLLLLLYSAFPCAAQALGRDSIIDKIQESHKSCVLIHAHTAILGKGPASAVRDPATNRILVLRNVGAATFERTGAGVIINPAGLIATNAHIVKDAGIIIVTLHDTSRYRAKLVWLAPENDIAFIRILPTSPLSPLSFSELSGIGLGDTVYNIGSSQFLDGTISQGRITGLGKSAALEGEKGVMLNLIQTDIHVYKGDSGGPLLDHEGKLLGLVVATQISAPFRTYAVALDKIKVEYIRFLNSLNES